MLEIVRCCRQPRIIFLCIIANALKILSPNCCYAGFNYLLSQAVGVSFKSEYCTRLSRASMREMLRVDKPIAVGGK